MAREVQGTQAYALALAYRKQCMARDWAMCVLLK